MEINPNPDSMDIDNENQANESLGINDGTLMKAKNIAPENQDNVLFQPAVNEADEYQI
jgi:hypothetical protein